MASDDDLLSTDRDRQPPHRDALRAETRAPTHDLDSGWPPESRFSLAGATDWLNGPPLGIAGLRGRVVLVSFWTYTCINWLRSLPHLRAWEALYRAHGLVVVGVHSPEFSFEHGLDNVRRAAEALSIDYPIALDNRFAVWRSFDNHYWPALYLIDARGRLRHHRFGEGGYDETDTVLRQLLTEAGASALPSGTVPVEGRGVEAAADWNTLRSVETYLGYDRTSGFASAERLVPDESRRYSAPARLRLGQWALSENWTVGSESTSSQRSGARLACRFHARDVHLVAAPGPGGPVRFRVSLDGREPGADHGVDVDSAGDGTITEPRLHQLLRRADVVSSSRVDLEFLDPGVLLYAFTFG